MSIEYRIIVDSEDDYFEYGHRESNTDGSGWVSVPVSQSVKLKSTPWFNGSPLSRMRYAGVETTVERAIEFEQAIDSDPSHGYYYLAAAASDADGNEVLKWIMGALATELNSRKIDFSNIGQLMPASVLGYFVKMLTLGKIDRTFSKQIFAELVTMSFDIGEEPSTKIDVLVSDPRFTAVDEADLEAVIDKIIADNPDQFEKAKANPKLIQWFLGQVMKATAGKAKPQSVSEIMNRKLS